MRIDFADFLQRADAVHLGHTDIEDDGRVGFRGDLREGQLRPIGGLHREIGRQAERDRLTWAVFIVDDKHRQFLGRNRGRGGRNFFG